jgi:hypothetical protein
MTAGKARMRPEELQESACSASPYPIDDGALRTIELLRGLMKINPRRKQHGKAIARTLNQGRESDASEKKEERRTSQTGIADQEEDNKEQNEERRLDSEKQCGDSSQANGLKRQEEGSAGAQEAGRRTQGAQKIPDESPDAKAR